MARFKSGWCTSDLSSNVTRDFDLYAFAYREQAGMRLKIMITSIILGRVSIFSCSYHFWVKKNTMAILFLSIVAGIIVIGGIWMATRDTKPTQVRSDTDRPIWFTSKFPPLFCGSGKNFLFWIFPNPFISLEHIEGWFFAMTSKLG